MYCPRCATENRVEQKYCRNCGLSLMSVRLALEGAVDESAGRIAKDVDRLASGAVTLVVFALIALATCFFSEVSAAINLVLGLLIGGPMIWRGMRGATRAAARLAAGAPAPGLEAPRTNAAALPAVPDTDRIAAPAAPIAEHTTYELKPPGGPIAKN